MGNYLVALQALGAWFERQKRVLPWRDQPTLYRVWISEIMLQQTQVVTVIPYFEKFVKSFPNVQALAQASEEEVLRHWAGLGYYSRARNLHRGAKKIIEQGDFPKTREGWLEIPGVGDYTAGAILSIALNQPEAILDGNVERVLSRVRRINRAGGDAPYKARLWRLSKTFVEDAHRAGVAPSVLNQALMELGATVCTPRKPLCAFCPLSKICKAKREGDMEAYPPRKKPKEWLKIREEMHCLWAGDAKNPRVLLRLRKAGEWRAGLWDLPEETPEKLGILTATSVGKIETRHVVTRHKITRVTYLWKLKPGASSRWKAAEAPGDLRWVSVHDPEVAVGSALKRVLSEISQSIDASL
jgi:A/G-specific adenine glycosylase